MTTTLTGVRLGEKRGWVCFRPIYHFPPTGIFMDILSPPDPADPPLQRTGIFQKRVIILFNKVKVSGIGFQKPVRSSGLIGLNYGEVTRDKNEYKMIHRPSCIRI